MSTTSTQTNAGRQAAVAETLGTDPTRVIRAFAEAIAALERTGDTEQLADLYTDDCRLGNVITDELFEGIDGVRDFWTKYHDELGDGAESSFSVMSGDTAGAVLEWTTNVPGGEGSYRGATVLEFNDDRIQRSMAYFDPSQLGRLKMDEPTPTDDGGADDAGQTGGDVATGWSGPSQPGDAPTTR